MAPFEGHLSIISQQVTIQDSNHRIYRSDFDKIRNSLFRYMKNNDKVFRKLYKGPTLFGSYSNNVRINCPNEFDVHIELCPPYVRDIIVIEDNLHPGFVHLNFMKVLESLIHDSNNKDIYDFLYEVTDNHYYLIRGKLQDWLENLFERAVNYCPSVNGFDLQYSKRGLAHNVFARHVFDTQREISIDFVPAFSFGKQDWMRIPTSPELQNKCERFYAIPKIMHGNKRNKRMSFLICNPDVEHYLLLNRQNLKKVFRLLKSLRERYNLNYLKSYFITTAFLFEIEKQKDEFWSYSIDIIFVHMLDKLSDYFIDGNLPFFWNTDLNLLDVLTADEILQYKTALIKAFKKLFSYLQQPSIKFTTVAQHFSLLK